MWNVTQYSPGGALSGSVLNQIGKSGANGLPEM
jgi:hypothetical protein